MKHSLVPLLSFFFFYFSSLPTPSVGFIVGGCIGPKSVLERFLNDKQKSELRKMVHNTFDGTNAEQVLQESNRYVFGHITEEQWHSIVPELAEYQAKKHECSVYAQLLPKQLYQQLLKSVLRASEMGASKYDVKRLVDDYVERLAKNGILPDVMDKAPTLPRVTLPEAEIAANSYRKYPKKPKVAPNRGNTAKNVVHPTLIGYPERRNGNNNNNGNRERERENTSKKVENNMRKPNGSAGRIGVLPDNLGIPMFPIARPSPFDLSEFISGASGRSNHQRQQNFRRYPPPEHECDYYAGPCATSF